MLSWFRRLAAPAAAVLALFVLGSAASADVYVRYYTSGFFGSGSNPDAVVAGGTDPAFPGGPYAGSASVKVDGGPGSPDPSDNFSSTLTYNYSGLQEAFPLANGDYTDISLGTFTVSSTDRVAPYDKFDGVQFTLNIFQLDPPIGGLPGAKSSLVGSVTGVLRLNRSGTQTQADSLFLTFNPNQLSIPQTGTPSTYFRVATPSGTMSINGSASGPTQLNGQVAVAPLPGVAWAGIALFSTLGGARGLKKLRRRQAGVTA